MKRSTEVQVGFRLDKELAEEFKAICARNGTPQQFVLKKAVMQFVEKERNKNPE